MTPKEEHKVKMGVKANLREHRYKRDFQAKVYIPANLGRNHPDYGMSWQEHLEQKTLRSKITTE